MPPHSGAGYMAVPEATWHCSHNMINEMAAPDQGGPAPTSSSAEPQWSRWASCQRWGVVRLAECPAVQDAATWHLQQAHCLLRGQHADTDGQPVIGTQPFLTHPSALTALQRASSASALPANTGRQAGAAAQTRALTAPLTATPAVLQNRHPVRTGRGTFRQAIRAGELDELVQDHRQGVLVQQLGGRLGAAGPQAGWQGTAQDVDALLACRHDTTSRLVACPGAADSGAGDGGCSRKGGGSEHTIVDRSASQQVKRLAASRQEGDSATVGSMLIQ